MKKTTNPTDPACGWLQVPTHIGDIVPGDTILERGQSVTISRSSIKRDEFMGLTLRGDSYNCGHRPVIKLVYVPPPNPYAWGAS